MVTYANELGMTVISFTNGMVIDKKIAKRLFESDISLIVKCNSMKPEIEDVLVGRKGYAERRKEL
jgi:MoaA/NifB/PqqE/SkfB family radical SAM enzyme